MKHHRARAWLAQRAGAVPPSLEARVEGAVDDVDAADDDVAGALADAALRCLADAIRAGDGREAAWPLLAADALITAACEAAADDTGEVRTFAERLMPARIAPLLPELNGDP